MEAEVIPNIGNQVPIDSVEQWIVVRVMKELFLAYSSSYISVIYDYPVGFPCKASAYNVGDLGSIPGSGRSPGEGNGNPLQYSCLENPMD